MIFFSDVFNLFNNLLLRDNLFRIRKSSSQSERPKWLSSMMIVVLVMMRIMLMVMIIPIMLTMVIMFVAMMVGIKIMVENNVEVCMDDHVIFIDTYGDYQP